MSRLVSLGSLLLVPFIFPEVAFAHAFGQQVALPLPIWIFLYGGAAAVVLSFILVGIFVDRDKSETSFRSKDISKSFFSKILAGKTSRGIFQLLSVSLLVLVIIAGLLGDQQATTNIAPTLFWIILLLGVTYLTAIFGNFWSVVNPWRTLVTWWEALAGGDDGFWRYPTKLSYFPALILYFLLIYNELLTAGAASIPHNLATLLIYYTVITFLGTIFFGRAAWFKYGEFFNVFFGLVAKISPFEGRSGKIYLRPPFVGLLEGKAESFSLLLFILFMLSSTAYDGFRSTSAWFRLDLAIFQLYDTFGPNGYQIFQVVALLISPLLFLAAYLILVTLMKILVRSPLSVKELALRFGYSLVPIAVVYNIAHYYTLIITQGQSLIALVSDPLGLGWNIFGTANFIPNIALLRADFIWYSQVFFIVLGHIAAVYLAHVIALQTFPKHRQALISQIPMLLLMVLYTVTGLWILSQPFSSGI